LNHNKAPGHAVADQPPTVMSTSRRRRRKLSLCAGGVVLLLVASVVGYGLFQYLSLTMGIKRSDILGGQGSAGGDANILIMGLDSRLDENGNPLPRRIYDALHAGDQQDGGLNANVLMLLHVPADGSRATEISIPRDDYVSLAGCPDGQCTGKIKQAYGLAFDQESRRLVTQGALSRTQRQQKERDAGRRAQISTVKAFLGGVPVDHFLEVTLVSFYQIAQVVQPITVCVKEATQDHFSGARFHLGRQQIDAAAALAFVRQRRDEVHPALNFTDLDRERRQQAFISSLAFQLKQADTFSDPVKLTKIFDVAKKNTAIDEGLDVLSFAREAANLSGGNVTFYALPIALACQGRGGLCWDRRQDNHVPGCLRRAAVGAGRSSPGDLGDAAGQDSANLGRVELVLDLFQLVDGPAHPVEAGPLGQTRGSVVGARGRQRTTDRPRQPHQEDHHHRARAADPETAPTRPRPWTCWRLATSPGGCDVLVDSGRRLHASPPGSCASWSGRLGWSGRHDRMAGLSQVAAPRLVNEPQQPTTSTKNNTDEARKPWVNGRPTRDKRTANSPQEALGRPRTPPRGPMMGLCVSAWCE
jgi:LCP family protein required for cell wall assembly